MDSKVFEKEMGDIKETLNRMDDTLSEMNKCLNSILSMMKC